MSSLLWLLPLLLLWPALWLLRVMLVTRLLCGLRLGHETVTGLEPEALPAHLREAAGPALAEWRALGFEFTQVHFIESQAHPGLASYSLELTRGDDPVRVRIFQLVDVVRAGTLYSLVLSTHSDGSEWVTTQHMDEEILPFTGCVVTHVEPDAPAAVLLERHRARIAALADKGVSILFLDTAAATARRQSLYDAECEALERLPELRRNAEGSYSFRFVAAMRKAMHALKANKKTQAQHRARLAAKPQPLSPETRAGFDYDAYKRSKAMRAGKMSSSTKTLMMLVSFAAFAFVLGWQMSVASMLSLIVALVFHEGGHLAGMWLFGYKDTQLLFLPFLGGVAVGHDERVLEPWKHLVILFLGPLPGLFLAMAGFFLIDNPAPWLNQALIITLSINLFNLLPLLPLDGGQILDYSLTGRFPRVHAVFYVLSVIGLFTLAVLLSLGTALIVFAVILAMQVPAKWRNANLIRQLRRTVPADAQEETVVRAVLSGLRDPKFGKSGWQERLQWVPGLVHTLRLPRAGWGTVCVAVLGMTSPLWLGLAPLAFWNLHQTERSVEQARAQAVAAGWTKSQRPVPGEDDPARNGALILQGLKGFDGKASAGKPRLLGKVDAEDLKLLHAAAAAPLFKMPVGEAAGGAANEKLRQHILRTNSHILLYREGLRLAKEKQADEALVAGLDLLRLSTLMRQDSSWWKWTDDQMAQRNALSVVESALRNGAVLDSSTADELLHLLDESAYISYAVEALPKGTHEMLVDSLAQSVSSFRERPGVWSFVHLLLRARSAKELAQVGRDSFEIQRRIKNLNTQGFTGFLPPESESVMAHWQLKSFSQAVALRRQACAAIRLVRARQQLPGGDGQVALELERHLPVEPITGQALRLLKDESGERLQFSGSENDPELLPFAWELPPRS